MTTVMQTVDLLLDAEDRLDIMKPAPIPVQKVFLPWVLEACMVDEYEPLFLFGYLILLLTNIEK